MINVRPYGLVLAGGGAKGAYQLGAWKAFRELGVEFSAVVGVSIGAINGAMIVSGEYEKALEFWNSASVSSGVRISEELKDPENLFSVRNIPSLFRELVKNRGIDASPTGELLNRFIDEDAVRKSSIRFGLSTFNLSDFSPLDIFEDKIPEGELVDYLLASAKIPFANKVGPEGEKFLDGGLYDNAPIGMIRSYGYNRLIVVDISNMVGLGHKKEIENSDIVYIRPYDADELGAAFDFSTEMFDKRVKMGYYDTLLAFGEISGRRYYFRSGDYQKLVFDYGALAVAQLENVAHEVALDKLKVYNKDEFLVALKTLCTEYKKEKEERESEAEPKFYDAFLKRFYERRTEKEFSEAIAVLDTIVT